MNPFTERAGALYDNRRIRAGDLLRDDGRQDGSQGAAPSPIGRVVVIERNETLDHTAFTTPTGDWHIDIVTSGRIGAVVGANATLWRFWSPSLNLCCASLATGLSIGFSIGASLDIDGESIGAALASSVGGNVNEHLTITAPFSAKQLRGASMNEISFGVTGGVAEIAGNEYEVRDAYRREMFEFKGGGISATLGLGINMGTFSHSEFNPPFAVPASRWEVLEYQQAHA